MNTSVAPGLGPRPGLVVMIALGLLGAASGTLIGPIGIVVVAAVGLLWGAILSLAAGRLSRSEPRRHAWANGVVFATVLIAGVLSGSALSNLLLMSAALAEAPQFFADLVRPPIGEAEMLPFFLLNTPMEWLLIPGVVLLTWPLPRQRRLALTALAIFVCSRIWTYVYFVPQIFGWAEGPAGAPLTPDQLDQAQLWVELSWVRLATDLATLALVLRAAFISRDVVPSGRAVPTAPSSRPVDQGA
jgi:energy-converting hydrogenase Eha subunit A